MTNDGRIAIRIDRTTWEALGRSLRYLHDHFDVPHAIDRAQLLASKSDVANTLGLLEANSPSGLSDTISMSPQDWSLYTHLIGYTCFILPAARRSDALLLEELFSQYSDWEESGFPLPNAG